MLADTEGDDWLYRRDPRIRLPRAEIGLRDVAGRPILRPELQLLYKSKGPRPKDEADFEASLPWQGAQARGWLRSALSITTPEHPWVGRL